MWFQKDKFEVSLKIIKNTNKRISHFRPMCPEEVCTTCKDNGFASYKAIMEANCYKQCDQCKLCVGDAIETVPECKKFCMNGAWACARNCNMGKHKCLYCGKSCMLE